MRVKKDRFARDDKKLILSVIVLIILISATLIGAWYFHFRYRSIEDIGEHVSGTKESPDFDHDLAGRTVLVKGEVTDYTVRRTTLGNVTFIELDDFGKIHIIKWKAVDLEIGEVLIEEVRFEWSYSNDEKHVYSPQLDFPNFITLPALEEVQAETSRMFGIELTPHRINNNTVKITVNKVNGTSPLATSNCSLTAGRYSWTNLYMDIGSEDRPLVDRIDNLSRSKDGIYDKIHFTDEDDNGMLDKGDHFVLEELEIPDTESGVKTYVLNINREPGEDSKDYPTGTYFFTMKKEGLFSPKSDEWGV